MKQLFLAFTFFLPLTILAGGDALMLSNTPQQGLVHLHIPSLITFSIGKAFQNPSPAMKKAVNYLCSNEDPEGRNFNLAEFTDQEQKLLIEANSNTVKEFARYNEDLKAYPGSSSQKISSESLWYGTLAFYQALRKAEKGGVKPPASFNELFPLEELDENLRTWGPEAQYSFVEHTDAPDVQAFLYACSLGMINYVQKHLTTKVDVHVKNDYALALAAKNGHTKIIELLFQQGIEDNTSKSAALPLAAGNGHAETVKLLIEHGADVHALDDLALWHTCYYGHVEAAKILIQHGADVHAWNDSALQFAVRNGHTKIIKLLINHAYALHTAAMQTGQQGQPQRPPLAMPKKNLPLLSAFQGTSQITPIRESHQLCKKPFLCSLL